MTVWPLWGLCFLSFKSCTHRDTAQPKTARGYHLILSQCSLFNIALPTDRISIFSLINTRQKVRISAPSSNLPCAQCSKTCALFMFHIYLAASGKHVIRWKCLWVFAGFIANPLQWQGVGVASNAAGMYKGQEETPEPAPGWRRLHQPTTVAAQCHKELLLAAVVNK